MLLPLQGAECRCLLPGVPLRSAPGYVLVAFSRRIHSISGRLCSLILLTNLIAQNYFFCSTNLVIVYSKFSAKLQCFWNTINMDIRKHIDKFNRH